MTGGLAGFVIPLVRELEQAGVGSFRVRESLGKVMGLTKDRLTADRLVDMGWSLTTENDVFILTKPIPSGLQG